MGETTFQTPMNEQIRIAREAMEKQERQEEGEEREIPLTDLLEEQTKLKSGSNKKQYALGDRYQFADFSQMHEAILNYILTNPGKGMMSRCAEAFGVSLPWLSTLVHSDLFQARLRDRNDEFFTQAVQPLQERMLGVAHATLDKIEEKLDDIEDPRILIDLEDKLLHRLGYAPKTAVSVTAPTSNTQNNYYVTPELLAQARENAKKGIANDSLPAPEGLQDNERTLMGEVVRESPALSQDKDEGSEGS